MASKLNEVKKRRNLETISLVVGAVTYIAESYPGAEPTEAVWNCMKQSTSGGAEILNVHPVFAAPGVDGAGLVALFGDD